MQGSITDVSTLSVMLIDDTSFYSKIIGSHGYTGHEIIAGLGVYNANARLYDPVTGRFLAPDPLIQDPTSTQNFNRYSYCLNNPLKYTDESGEIIGTVLTAVVGGAFTIVSSTIKAIDGGIDGGWQGALNSFLKEWKLYGNRVANAARIDKGLVKSNPSDPVPERIVTILRRFTWELPQTVAGNLTGHFRNIFWRVNVSYYNEATLINRNDNSGWNWGATLGPYINGKNLVADPKKNSTFAHEYGHVIQSKILGLSYLLVVGLPSGLGCAFDGVGHSHDNEWYEVWANQLADNYYLNVGDLDASNKLRSSNPIAQTGEWYNYFTYYMYLAILATLII